MPNSIFVSYRRSDSQYAAIALADALSWAFPEGEVFFDRAAIQGSNEWPSVIRNAARQARLLVVLIGEGWLQAADQYGRRRLDHPDDWVRQELLAALERRIEILPVTLENAGMPPAEAFDAALVPLTARQSYNVRAQSWERDLHTVIDLISTLTGTSARMKEENAKRNPNGTPIPRPEARRSDVPIMSEEFVRQALEDIPPWQFERNRHLWAKGGQAEELSRVYEFRSFRNAVHFMADASEAIRRWVHHPRWENQWCVVKVWFSTWDVGCRVTQLDFDAARRMEKLYRDRDPMRCA